KSGAPGNGGNGAGRHPGPIDEQALLDEIRRGENYHVPMAQLAGLWAHRGADRDFAKTRLRDAFYAMPGGQRDKRWRDRFEDIGRTVDDIYDKHAGGSEQTAPDVREFPAMAREAFIGLPGEIVDMI